MFNFEDKEDDLKILQESVDGEILKINLCQDRPFLTVLW